MDAKHTAVQTLNKRGCKWKKIGFSQGFLFSLVFINITCEIRSQSKSFTVNVMWIYIFLIFTVSELAPQKPLMKPLGMSLVSIFYL